MDNDVRRVRWIGDSKQALAAMPQDVRVSFGTRLYELQKGKHVHNAKALPSLGSGVFELRESYDTNAYRLMYVLKLKKSDLCPACVRQEIEIGNRPAEDRCKPDRKALEGCDAMG
jgi:Gp49-like protein DUF891